MTFGKKLILASLSVLIGVAVVSVAVELVPEPAPYIDINVKAVGVDCSSGVPCKFMIVYPNGHQEVIKIKEAFVFPESVTLLIRRKTSHPGLNP